MIYFLMSIVVLSMVIAQLLLKKGLSVIGSVPNAFGGIIPFVQEALSNPYILLSMLSTVVTVVCWIAVLAKSNLSQMYPFMGLSYVLVALFAVLFLKEQLSIWNWVGIFMICGGVFIVMKG